MNVEALATAIDAARRSGELIEPFTATQPDIDLPTAYAVAQRASELRYADTGSAPVGRKIGFTNRTLWDRYGVHHPIWGWMYEDTVVLTGDDEAIVQLVPLLQPRIEPEIVVRLAAPVAPGATAQDVAAAAEWIAFGYEIVHTHFPGWKFRAADAVIDASLHAGSRIGPRFAPWPTMLADLSTFSLTFERDGIALGTGQGSDVLDSPLHAIAHLAEVVGGDGLAAGEILTTGTVTDAAPAAPGERYSVSITGLPLTTIALRCV